ncbi:uncharacterized protein M6B38_259645 [Iris pallida]|uniref:DUF3444 domain-containing protein n=1 Tax=Iris pallida TaxID=29817 RepID=A0AAX6IFI7_IRIPA|nr:uncharacterized protein M6B38_259645 [Iris pallida]
MDEEKTKVLRMREAIEAKMHARDYDAARTLILDALKTSPRLAQASEMLTVCEILCSAEMELPGSGIDWYWILQLYSAAEPSAIEAQYQKIVSQLKRIMHDFPGTELALNFATDAFSVLSDPEKRAAFDSKREVFQNITAKPTLPSSSSAKRDAEEDCSEVQTIDEKKQMKKICTPETSCIYDQVNPFCSPSAVAQKRPAKDFYDFEDDRKADSFSEGQVWATYDQEHMPRLYGKIDKIVPQKILFYVTWFKALPHDIGGKGRKWYDAGFPFACGTFAPAKNTITLCGPSRFSHMISNCINRDQIEVYPKNGEVWAIYRDWDSEWCSDPKMRDECGFEMIEILTDYSKDSGIKVAYLVRVEGFKNVFQRYSKRGNELSFQIPVDKILMFSHKVPSFRFVGGERIGISKGMLELDPLAVPDNLVQDLSCAIVALVDSGTVSIEEVNCSDEASISNMANPSISTTANGESSSGIKSRKSKLTPDDFSVDQVWAVYDGPDAMPRHYVKVVTIVSSTQVCVAFLEPHPMLDQEIQWVEESLPMACGVFRAGRSTTILDMSKFSHTVNCERSSKKLFYRIFPKRGEVWAMYKNWNINWKNYDLNLNGYQCQMVEILSDFSEESGVSMCCLVEVQGYLTFFQRQMHNGFQLFKQVSRLELLSFSHRIPAFTVLDIQNCDVPKGSLHLEPDALPQSL